MRVERVLFIGCLLLLMSCKSNHYVSFEDVDEIEKDCDRLRLKKFEKLNKCEQILYLRSVKEKHIKIASETFADMLFIVADKSGISPSISFGIAGSFYKSDTLFNYDLQRWNTIFGCDTIVQIKTY